MDKVELMAPAGNVEALKAAVANGADAVYLGGKQFNARQGAANFEREEMKWALDYAHERDVAIYVTVNTVLSDAELPEAMEYLYFLGEAGADAIIVQDLGLVDLARRLLPELPLIGSTQMTITNARGAKYLQQKGMKRVVLGRELTLQEITAIRKQVELELEVFAHGALCFAYSGQCLLSSMVGGRSGNRGCCAQPCRLAYTLVDAKGRKLEAKAEHLLSTRDLCTLTRIPQLIASGVNAFKIEGRMRRPEYVAVVTRTYRRVIDRYLERPEEFKVFPQEEQEVAQIFNRDFTTGYLEGNPGAELMGYGRPSNRGLYLGRVGRRQGRCCKVHLEAPLNRGDGLDVWVSRGGHQGVVVHKLWQDGREVTAAAAGATVELELPAAARPGDRIFKTSDIKLLDTIRRTYTSPHEEGRVPVGMKVSARAGEPLQLEVFDREGQRVKAVSQLKTEAASRHPLDDKVLAAQLGRLGNTPFKLEKLVNEIEGSLMLPFSELNRLRREAVAKLRRQRLAAWPQRVPPLMEFKARWQQVFGWPFGEGPGKGKVPAPTGSGSAGAGGLKPEVSRRQRSAGAVPRLAVAVGDAAAARAALAAGAERVYLGGEVWQGREPIGRAELEALLRLAGEQGAELIPALPRLWHEQEEAKVSRRLELLLQAGAATILVANAGSLQMIKERGVAGWADYPLNLFNSWSVAALAREGLKGVTLSPELNLEQLRQIAAEIPLEVVVHGALPLMVSAHCVLGARLGGRTKGEPCTAPCRRGGYALQDRQGLVFPLTVDRECRFYLYNAKEMSLVDRLNEIARLGVSWVRLEAREKQAAYVKQLTGLYRRALSALGTGREKEVLAAAAREAEKLAPAGTTRGHYYRGVV